MNQTKIFVRAALFAAITAVATMAVAIPLPGGGYANLGDTAVLLAAFFLPPMYAALAAGLGAALADVLLSFALYAPATFVIKAAMALLVGFVLRRRGKGRLFAVLGAECLMVAGYFGFESIMYGAAGAVPALTGNILQGVLCASAALVLYRPIAAILNRKEN